MSNKSKKVPEFQIVFDNHAGIIRSNTSLEELYLTIKQNGGARHVQKISWCEILTDTNKSKNEKEEERIGFVTDGNVHHLRFIPKKRSIKWSNEAERIISSLHGGYKNAHPDQIFWIHQKIMDTELLKQRNGKSEEEWDKFYYPKLIVDVKTKGEFEQQYIYNPNRNFKMYEL